MAKTAAMSAMSHGMLCGWYRIPDACLWFGKSVKMRCCIVIGCGVHNAAHLQSQSFKVNVYALEPA